jgi:VanZ family protein
MTIKTLLAHKNLWLTIAIIWTGIIFYLCLIDSSELPSLKIKINNFDKVVHFCFHFIFTIFWLIYSNITFNKSFKNKIVNVIVLSFFTGVLIEVLQGCFTTSRKADVLDVLANTTGAITAGIVMYFILKRINKLKT